MRNGLQVCCMLCYMFFTTVAFADDSYFNRAITKIEETLVRPAQSYGFEVLDEYSNSTNRTLEELGTFKEGFVFYVSGGNVHFRLDRYDPSKPREGPYLRHYVVVSGKENSVVECNVTSKHTSVTNNAKATRCRIGAQESYEYYFATSKNGEHPDRQPFQILANPCFAPLRITPMQLRALVVTEMPSEGFHKVFQVRKNLTSDVSEQTRLTFSTEYGDALVMSQQGMVKNSNDKADEYLNCITRTVKEWHELPKGVFVPALISVRHEVGGKTTISLIRRISKPVIGEVDEGLFDTKTIVDFNNPERVELDGNDRKGSWERVAARRLSRDSPLSSYRSVFIALNLVVVIVVATWIVRRRLMDGRAKT